MARPEKLSQARQLERERYVPAIFEPGWPSRDRESLLPSSGAVARLPWPKDGQHQHVTRRRVAAGVRINAVDHAVPLT